MLEKRMREIEDGKDKTVQEKKKGKITKAPITTPAKSQSRVYFSSKALRFKKELKWDKSAKGAVEQIKNRQYCKSLAEYRGNISYGAEIPCRQNLFRSETRGQWYKNFLPYKAPAKWSFSNDMVTFCTKDDVLTLLIHLGYLGYDFDNESVYIPNMDIPSPK